MNNNFFTSKNYTKFVKIGNSWVHDAAVDFIKDFNHTGITGAEIYFRGGETLLVRNMTTEEVVRKIANG